MKYKLCICLLLIISCLSISCSNNINQSDSSADFGSSTSPTQGTSSFSTHIDNCKLIVNGKDIAAGNYVRINKEYAELPFTAIMEALGSKIIWLNQTNAIIIFRNESYILDTAQCTLIEAGGNINFLSAPPGGTQYYKTAEKELVLDDSTMNSAFYLMKADIDIKINYNDSIITINS